MAEGIKGDQSIIKSPHQEINKPLTVKLQQAIQDITNDPEHAVSRRELIKAGGLGLLTSFSAWRRGTVRGLLQRGTPPLTHSPSIDNTSNLDITTSREFNNVEPDVLFKSQNEADFSELEKFGYRYVKQDENGVFQDSDSPEIRLVKNIYWKTLSGNFSGIGEIKFRRGVPSTNSIVETVREKKDDSDNISTFIAIRGDEAIDGKGDIWWIKVGGEDVNGRLIIHSADPENHLIPKDATGEDGMPYLLYDTFVNPIPLPNN